MFDPHTDEEGCFGWIGGNIEKLSDIRVGYSQAVELSESGLKEYEEGDEEMDEDLLAHSAYKKQPANKTGPREPEWMKWMSMSIRPDVQNALKMNNAEALPGLIESARSRRYAEQR